MTTALTPTRPAPIPQPVAPAPPAAVDCGMCNGRGGTWITGDSGTPGKNVRQWVPCTGCKGTGQK